MFLLLLLSGCSTLITLTRPDIYISSSLRKVDTNCESISRVYSGVSYGLCRINARPSHYSKYLLDSFFLFDTIPSFIADTVALPYTCFKQLADDSVVIYNQ